MVKFKRYEIHNYQSIKDLSINLDNRKVYCVVGKNGSGKSSIFEGLIWVLYGKSRSNNFIREGSVFCYGKVELEINGKSVLISRYKNHPEVGTSVRININGKDLVLHTIKEVNRKIEDIIGSYELFQSCVVLSQGLPYDFTSLTPTTRKVVFEEIVGIAFWDKIREKLQKKLKELQAELNKIFSDISELESKQSFLKGRIEELENKTRLSLLERELEKARSEKENIERQLVAKTKIDINLIRDKLNRTIRKLSLLEKEYNEKFSILESGICPTCGQPFPSSLMERTKERLKALKEAIIQLKDMKYRLEKERDLALKQEKLLVQFESLSGKVEYLRKAIDESKIEVREKLSEIEKDLNLVQTELDLLRENQSRVEENIEFIDYVINLLKPSSYFRTKLLNRYIEVLNSILDRFSSLFKIKFVLRKGIELEIKREGKLLDLKQLSGGERRKVSIIILLSLQQFMERIGGVRTNLLVVDEIFDALDFSNLQYAVEMFSTFEGRKTIFIITHNELLKEMVPEVIEVEKVEGISSYSNLP